MQPSAPRSSARPRRDADRAADVRLGRAHVRHGHPQRDARLVLRRRPARRARPRATRVDAAVATGRRWSRRARTSSTSGANRPGRGTVTCPSRRSERRVVPIIAAIRAALPDTPISVDTTKPSVAEAALAAGADLINDVWGVGKDDALAPPRRRPRRPAGGHAQPGGAALHLVPRRGRRRPPAGHRPGPPPRRRLGRPDRRPGLRVRQDARPQPGAPPRARPPAPAGPADPARHEPQVDARSRPRACRPTSASRRPWRRRRSGSPAAPTSSASTTSRPTSAPPG